MPNVVRIKVRGVDYAPYVDSESVSATNNVVMTQDGMSFTVYLDGEVVVPRAGSEVIWGVYDADTGVEVRREFAGIVSQVRESVYGSTLQYDVTCQSYLRHFDRRIVNGFFQQQLAETTIKAIVASYCPGFTTTNVVAPFTLSPQYAEYRRPSQMVKQIAEQVGYGFYIDYSKDVHTYRVEDFVSPIPGNLLNLDTDVTSYGDLEITEDAESVYNRFTIRGFKMRSATPYTLNFLGDGTTKQWSLGYRFSSAKDDSTVTVAGVSFPVKRDILDGIPGQANDPGNAYVHWTQHQIRFANAPASGAVVSFTGYPLISRPYTNQDNASIKYMKDLENSPASDGVFESSETNKSFTQSTMKAIREKVEMLALKHGYPTLSGRMTSYLAGWRAGQSFRMVSTKRMGGTITADAKWYVYRVTKRWIQPMHSGASPIQYQIDFADKPYLV